MALSPQLLQFKSSGVYRLEFDKSQTANIDVSTLRLVVGHSRKGPYNTPVLIENVEAFIQVYGNIDKSLEKKGMFFHRSAQAALSRGPILALNLAGFKNDPNTGLPEDTASSIQISTNGSYDVTVAGEQLTPEQLEVIEVQEVTATQQDITDGNATAADGPQQGAAATALTDIMVAYVAPVAYAPATFAPDTFPDLEHQVSDSKAYASFFDTDKFMIPSDEKVLQTLGEDPNQILNFVNIKQTPITVFTRKAQSTPGFNITAREW